MKFLILSVVVFILIAFLIPKRMTKIEMFTTCLFALLFQKQVDIFLALKYHLYGYIGEIRFANVIINYGLFSAVNIILLNYYPFKKSLRTKAYYILSWDAFLVAFEWATVKSGYFYHNGWKYWYSAVLNPIIILILTLCLIFVRKINHR